MHANVTHKTHDFFIKQLSSQSDQTENNYCLILFGWGARGVCGMLKLLLRDCICNKWQREVIRQMPLAVAVHNDITAL